jgi:hypothetical protein
MPQRSTSIHIPQPCAESWAAMTPTTAGRHCAACQKTVVDFTEKSDAEIVAYLAKATGETCGRLRSDQQNRPLLPALGARPAARWRAWLALVLAAWGLRASPAAATGAPAAGPPKAAHPPKKAGPKHRLPLAAPKLLRGTVRASDTHEPLAGVAVFLKGENRSATTDTAGNFSLALPARRPRMGRALVLHYAGYQSEIIPVGDTPATALQLELQADPAASGATIVGYGIQKQTQITSGMLAVTRPEVVPLSELRARQSRSFWQRVTQPFR